ncbi:hypothetical protein [Caballeronia concitans]|uniref:Uncharacterized protein n=1 Tax=Caballeronia concitans TaxID=1777133 RepID=A0A658QSP1_9BURK|nr:hypothetical protein [Caballeronia concitans]KIG04275.1 hypothetical protein BurMR1_4355 [Burkholderia sp. MR1]SAL16831.1 hypothetical protein AWB72_01013 [Caballeronia concitans]
MMDLSGILIGVAIMAALGIVLFAHDWRTGHRRDEPMHTGARRQSLRDWWMRHRH